jgi:YD repeat-containing protein
LPAATKGQAPRRTGTSQETSTSDTDYAYDSLGRLESVTLDRRNGDDVDCDPVTEGDQPEVTDYIYDLLGNLDKTRLSNGVISDYDYDALNRLTLDLGELAEEVA